MILKALKKLKISNSPHFETLKQETFRYVLGLASTKKINDVARLNNVFPEMKKLKQNFLKASDYTLSKFWKSVVTCLDQKCAFCANKKCRSFQHGDAHFLSHRDCFKVSYKLIAEKQGIHKDDLKYALSILTPKDTKHILDKFKERGIYSNVDKDAIFKKLYPWVQRIVFKKFRFVLASNWSEEASDIVHDLMLEGYLRALECDTINDELYLVNCIKQRISLRATNKLKYYTRKVRSRLSENTEEKKQQISKIKKDNKNISAEKVKQQLNTTYSLNQLSLDYAYGDSTFHDYFSYDDTTVEDNDSMVKIIDSMPNETFKRAIKILTGYPDKEFQKFLSKNNLEEKKNLQNVLSFFNLSKQDFYAGIKPALVNNEVLSEKNFLKLVS